MFKTKPRLKEPRRSHARVHRVGSPGAEIASKPARRAQEGRR
jgi:hypothetical protein